MEYIEVSARTVDDAITEALIKLGATSDQIEYEVIEKGSTGFLGIARKDAVIKVRKKYSVEGDITEFLQKIFAAMDLKVEKEMTWVSSLVKEDRLSTPCSILQTLQ